MTKFAILIFAVLLLEYPFLNIAGETIIHSPSDLCEIPANTIVAENCKEGTSDWHIEHLLGDIEGFASATSVAPGEQIDFFVNTDAEQFVLNIYRSGYYNGRGGRLVHTVELPGQMQPHCQSDLVLGVINCANWSRSYRLAIPQDWISGVYMAKLVRPDTHGENYIIFVVREKNPAADIVMQLSVTTYQAYNYYGNKSLYSSLSFDYCPTISEAPRAVAVSFDRPNSLGVYFQNTYFWTDYPMVYWLEAQGYDVGYISNIDTHSYGTKGNINELLKHRIFLSVGHDEYWSQAMRDAITEARDRGLHLGFFSSNVSYWRIRLEPNLQTGAPDRMEVVYKTTESGPPDPSGQPTTTWRDPDGANNPENSLIGIQYVGDNDIHYFPLQVSARQSQDTLYRNTPLQTMPPDSIARVGKHLIGWEWDAVTDNGLTPASLSILAESPTSGAILADAGRIYSFGVAHSNVTRYVTPQGTIVFAAGTNHWSWGLAVYEPNPIIQQITYNLFSDMGVQPASPATTLILDVGDRQGGSASVVTRQVEVQKDVRFISKVENLLRSWGVADFQMAAESDPAYVVHKNTESKEPTISNIQTQSGFDSIVISWDTDQPTSGQVWIKSAPGPVDWSSVTKTLGAKPVVAGLLNETLSQHHKFVVSTLVPNTKYFYHISSRNEYGQATTSSEQNFVTLSGGSITSEAKRYLTPFYRQAKCSWKADPLVYTGVGVLALGLFVWSGWRLRRHRVRMNV